MRQRKTIVLGLTSLLALGGLASCGAPAQQAQNQAPAMKTIKVGFLAPMTGDAGAYGEATEKIGSYYLDKINEELAPHNMKMELIFEDGKCSGTDAVSAFQKLTDVDGAKAVIGGFCSSETLGMAPLANANHILLMSPGSSNPSLAKAGEYVFSYSYSDALVGEGIVAELKKYKKVALISEQNDYNVGLQKAVKEGLAGSETEVVADEVFAKGGTNFRNALQKVLAAQPEAVFLNPNVGVTAENLIKQLAEDPAWKNVKLVSQFAYLQDASRASVKDMTEGMVIVDAPVLDDPKLMQLIDDITATKGDISTLGVFYTASTMDDMKILADLLIEYGEDYDAIKNALRSRTFDGFTSDEIYFGPDSSFNENLSAARFVVKDGIAAMSQE